MGKEMGEKSQREEEGITKRETKMREEKEEKGIKGIEKKGLNIRDSEDKGKILWLMALSLINRLDKENNIRNPENKGQNIQWLEEKGKILWLMTSNLKGRGIRESEDLVKTQWLMISSQKNKEDQFLEDKEKTQWSKDLFHKNRRNHLRNKFLIWLISQRAHYQKVNHQRAHYQKVNHQRTHYQKVNHPKAHHPHQEIDLLQIYLNLNKVSKYAYRKISETIRTAFYFWNNQLCHCWSPSWPLGHGFGANNMTFHGSTVTSIFPITYYHSELWVPIH